MHFAGAYAIHFGPQSPLAAADLPALGSRAWRELEFEILREYAASTYRIRGATMRAVHPADFAHNALADYVASGEFTSDDVETPRLARYTYRGLEWLLLEAPRPLAVHGRA